MEPTASIAEVSLLAKSTILKCRHRLLTSHTFFLPFKMFSNVDRIDLGLMFLGSLGSLIVGLSFPAMDLFFGRILNSLNSNSDFVEDINTLCSYLVIIAAFNIVAGYLQVSNCSFHPAEQPETLISYVVYVLGVLLDLHW